LLDERLAAFTPERRGRPDLYFVGVAADKAARTPSTREVARIKELLDERFDAPAGGHSGEQLRNADQEPIATVSNLRTRCLFGNTIDTDDDIVLLHYRHARQQRLPAGLRAPAGSSSTSSRGSALARMLADSGIKWKGDRDLGVLFRRFHRTPQDDNTLVINRRRPFHSSFGCSYDSDYTCSARRSTTRACREPFSSPRRSTRRRKR